MSIYDYEKVALPQVKIASQDKQKLLGFLAIFHRSYAEFVRDLCDANVKWHAADISQTFHDHATGVSHLVTKRYIETDARNLRSKKALRRSVREQLQLHRYPNPVKVVRLPVVTVSKWQADNLQEFLDKYSRTYADFIRMACQNVFIDTIEAQAALPQFADHVHQVFVRIYDEMLGVDRMREKRRAARQWPENISKKVNLFKINPEAAE